MTNKEEKAIKRHVIGNRVELIMYENRNVIVFYEDYTHKPYYEWKNKHSALLREFFKK